jgi:hypothetical protein
MFGAWRVARAPTSRVLYRGYVAKTDRTKKPTKFDALPKKAKLKKNTPTDYLKEDPFPTDRDELVKLQKKVDIKEALSLTSGNPFSGLIDGLGQQRQDIKDSIREKEKEAPSDELLQQALQSRASWEAQKPKDTMTADQRKLQQMSSSAQELSKRILQRKLAAIDPSKVSDLTEGQTKLSLDPWERSLQQRFPWSWKIKSASQPSTTAESRRLRVL